MGSSRAIVVFAFLVVLAAPLVVRQVAPATGALAKPPPANERQTLIIVTPHIEQIRDEFGAAFAEWHARKYPGEPPVYVDWRVPGGTTEILRLLQAVYQAQYARGLAEIAVSDPAMAQSNAPPLDKVFPTGSIDFDLMFGGGSYDHTRLKTSSPPMSVCADFSQAQLDEWFGENAIGAGQLYQDGRKKSGKPDDWQHWLGAALSGFGIVYNRELIREAGLSEPVYFEDLCDYRYYRRVALADARQSGSVATLYDSILNESASAEIEKAREQIARRGLDAGERGDQEIISELIGEATGRGWDHGWRVLRELCANAHGFAASSTYPPMAVSQGEALAGVCIDFYGRGQAQAVLALGEDPDGGRVGYIDPPGRVFIDADPVSILRGGPNPVLARRFVEFCMSRQGQALWQFPPTGTAAGQDNPRYDVGGASVPYGPRAGALRRMPARRDMYEPGWKEHFVDRQADPFRAASRAPSQGWRDGMIVMMGCLGVDTAEELREAWEALHRARESSSFPKETLAEMESLFYAMPTHAVRNEDGSTTDLIFTASNYKRISADTNRWRDPIRASEARIAYTAFFRDQYRKVAELGRRGERGVGGDSQ
ncbi:MAG: ABC transporter substrate-binding protein [Phycisphaerales bacterium]